MTPRDPKPPGVPNDLGWKDEVAAIAIAYSILLGREVRYAFRSPAVGKYVTARAVQIYFALARTLDAGGSDGK